VIRRAKLYAVIETGGKYKRLPVFYDPKGKPQEPQGYVTSYKVRVAGKFLAAGKNFAAAVTRLKQEQARLADGVARAEAIADTPVEPEEPTAPERTRLSDAAVAFVNELRSLGRKRHSVTTYESVLRRFQKSCHKEFVDEIDRRDILTFLDWMRENIEVRVPGSESRTYKNKLNYLGTFLARQGVRLSKKSNGPGANDPGLLFRSDMPKVVKKKPRKYDQETIDALLAKADIDEKDYLEFLLWSGFRDEEVQYTQFSDFNFRNSTVTVHAKPQYGWKPKDYEEREITLPTPVMKRIKDRMARATQYTDGFRKATENDLVFPSPTGRPDLHLIYRLHAVAKKAGLNLKGKRAGHMFRKTAGSRVAKREGLPAAMEFLGHSNIETTALYLAADSSGQTKKRKVADEMYSHHQSGGND
jgi:integrase